MGWTLTSVVSRLATPLGLRRRWNQVVGPARLVAAPVASNESGGVMARVYARRLAALSTADRKALEAAHAQLDGDFAVVERAAASGAPLAAIAALASAWAGLPAATRVAVRDPVGRRTPGKVMLGSVHATQVDHTTCGAASMGLMLMIGDPLVALWVMTGRLMADYAPPEVARMRPASGAQSTIEQRWQALQRQIHSQTTSRALWVAPWPRALGTPPWAVGAVMRFGGVRLRGAMVDHRHKADLRALITVASAALNDGIPVPLYSCGSSAKGITTVMPRHVVLLTARVEGGFQVYEPGSGALYVLRDSQLLRGDRTLKALGNWQCVCWMVLPRPRATSLEA